MRTLFVVYLTILASFAAAQLQAVPGCLATEPAIIINQTIFDVFLPSGAQTNLTLTSFTCPSRQALGPAPPGTPIELCGLMDSSSVFQGTFSCTQGTTGLPLFSDCDLMSNTVVDNLIRPLEITIAPEAGLIVSMDSNTCAMVFLNDDVDDTYQTCLHTIPDLAFDISEECPNPIENGFIGSVRSLVEPGVQNWEVHIASADEIGL
uniref:Uncharacterized protein n=1 Tax=Mycena chlorophos TaxID=658473 RepID=A0ABQ0L027_MYCCL|nr:predicted protein [Mycena chlorophos]